MQVKLNTYSNYNNYTPTHNGELQNSRQTFKGYSDITKLSKKQNIFVKANDLLSEGLAHCFGTITSLKPVQKGIEFFSKSENAVQHLSAAVGLILSGFYMRGTAKSKKIEPEQKRPLIINQGVVAVLATASAYTLDNILNNKYKKFENTFMKVNKQLVAGNEARWKVGLKNAKTIAVFAMVYRFFGPVVATPIANKLSNYLSEREKAQKTTRTQQA